jgi:hypothetical protein
MTLANLLIVITSLVTIGAVVKLQLDKRKRLQEAQLLSAQKVREFQELLAQARNGSQEALDEFRKRRDEYLAKYNASNKPGSSDSTH